jgi:hypothetical protein
MQTSKAGPGQAPALTTVTSITFEPLRQNGRDALDTHDVPALGPVSLNHLCLAWPNYLHDSEILHADDLFSTEITIPKGAKITEAAFTAKPAGQDLPQPFTVSAKGVRTAAAELRAGILDFLTKRRYAAALHAIQFALALFLAAVASALPDLPDLGDDDDDSDDHQHLTHNRPDQVSLTAAAHWQLR